MRRSARVRSALICALLAVSLCLSGTLAWKSLSQTARNDVRLERSRTPVELTKYERDIDGQPTETPIPGAEFFLFTADGTQIGGALTTDALGKIVRELAPGSYYFEETYPGLGYGFDLDGGRPVTRYPFTVTGDEEKVTVTVYDRRLWGPLMIQKTVANADGSPLTQAQKDQLFTFTVTFSDGGTYLCQIDGGATQLVTSGGTIRLHHGQTVVFPQLPVGVQYTVTEAPAAGYGTTSSGSHGHITQEGQKAEFTNTRDPEEPEKCALVVKKELAGEWPPADRDKEFHFVLTVNGEEREFTLRPGESMTFEDVKFGDEYTIVETDVFPEGYSLHTVNASGTIVLALTEAVFTNTYVGRPQVEIGGEKTWVTDEAHRGLIPGSIRVRLYGNGLLVEEKTVAPDGDGRWRYTFHAPKYDQDGKEIVYTIREGPVDHFAASYEGYDIVNTYVPPVTQEGPELTKVVTGSGAPLRRFRFVLEALDGAPLPGGAAGSVKRYDLDGAGKLDLGTFTFTRPGTFVYTIREVAGNESNWTYDGGVYTLTFTVTEENGALMVRRSLTRDGVAADRLVFRNHYARPSPGNKDDEVTLRGHKRWVHGDAPEEARPESVVVYVYADGELVYQQVVTAKNDWLWSVTLPKYARGGREIVYTVGEEPVPGYELEVDGFDLVNTYVGTAPSPSPSGSGTPSESPSASGSPAPSESVPPSPVPTPTESPAPTPVPTSPPPDVPKTGDTGELWLWLAVMAAGGFGLLGCGGCLLWEKYRYKGRRLRK